MATGHNSLGNSMDYFHDKKEPSETVRPNGIAENGLAITIDSVRPDGAPAGGAALSFKDLTYSVKVKRGEEKVIVNGVSGCVQQWSESSLSYLWVKQRACSQIRATRRDAGAHGVIWSRQVVITRPDGWAHSLGQEERCCDGQWPDVRLQAQAHRVICYAGRCVARGADGTYTGVAPGICYTTRDKQLLSIDVLNIPSAGPCRCGRTSSFLPSCGCRT